MSIADELRHDADAALKEAGMYYSGEYLSGIAKRVEEVEAENAKLREQGARLFDKTLELGTENAKLRGIVAVLWECCACNTDSFWCEGCDYHDVGGCKVRGQIDRLGIEVE